MKLPAFYKLVAQQEMDAAGMSNVVPGWASFAIWLIDRQGTAEVHEALQGANEVKDAHRVLRALQGDLRKDFQEMDREWRLWVLRYQPRKMRNEFS